MKRRSPRTLQALAIAPGLAVSTVLTCMIGALLPPWAGLCLFIGGLTLMVLLCAGGLEDLAVRLVYRGRPLSEAEAAALAPAVTLLCQRRLGPPLVTLYVRPHHAGITAGAVGRCSILISNGLIQAAELSQLPTDQLAAVLAHQVGRSQLRHTTYDVGLEFWTLPWQLISGTSMAAARAVAWLPLIGLAWKVRPVVATVAVVESVADGRPAAGAVVAVFMALTYLAPQWSRASEQRSRDDADQFVTDHALGEALGRFLRRCPP